MSQSADPVSAIAMAVGQIMTSIPAIMGIRTQRSFAKEDRALRERLAIWDSWFDQACKTRQTVAEIAWNDPTSQGDYIRRFRNFQDWFNSDGNFRGAYTVFLNYEPKANLYQNDHCPIPTLYLIIGAAALVLILLFIFSNKK